LSKLQHNITTPDHEMSKQFIYGAHSNKSSTLETMIITPLSCSV
jgi:hypothetical protein